VRRIERRRFLLAAGALAAAPLARAQDRDRLPVLGVLSAQPRPDPKVIADNPFTNRLRELGWIEGRTLAIERAYGQGREDALPALAEGLVRKRVDVIWAIGPEAALAAARATKSIPIVFWGVSFPVERGLVESLARPGRNATGVAWFAGASVDAKRVQVLREMTPQARRLAWLRAWTVGFKVDGTRLDLDVFDSAAKEHDFELRRFTVTSASDFEGAFKDMLAWKAEAMVAAATTLTVREMPRIVDFANRNRLPASYGSGMFTEAGGLMSYGSKGLPPFSRCAEQVDLILRGANPADLPVDIPRDYELVINLRTAKAIGLTIPQSLLLRADRVIQ
jgi:putative ABC transport system substrate-binding protein